MKTKQLETFATGLQAKAKSTLDVVTDIVCRGLPADQARKKLLAIGLSSDAADAILRVDFNKMFLAVIQYERLKSA